MIITTISIVIMIMHLGFDIPRAQGEVLADTDQDLGWDRQADHLSYHKEDNDHDADDDDDGDE